MNVLQNLIEKLISWKNVIIMPARGKKLDFRFRAKEEGNTKLDKLILYAIRTDMMVLTYFLDEDTCHN